MKIATVKQKVVLVSKVTLACITVLLMAPMANATATNPAGLKCYINLSGPCHNDRSRSYVGWFVDSDAYSHIDGARCMARATEWYNYCGNPVGLLTVHSLVNATRPTGGEVNVIFSYRNLYGAGIYGPSNRFMLQLK